MTSPRTPRQWNAGDPEPADRPTLRGRYEGLAWSYEGASEQAPWIREDGIRGSWEHVLHFGAPLSEVLPETPEPPRPECECFATPEEQWTRHYDATEPGSMVEPNPDCPVHFPASQSVPAVPVSSTGGKETGEAAEGATEALSDPKVELTKAIAEAASIPQWRAALAASFLIDEEGWRPPLPDSETEPGSFADAFLRASADTADMDVISARMAAEGWQEKRAVRVDRETEWARRWPDGTVRAISNSQAQAEDTIFPTTQLVRREVGPWIEVTS